MFQLFTRNWLPPLHISGALQRAVSVADVAIRSRPDFDLSDFEEPTPTVPGGYWHESDGLRDDIAKVS